MSNDNKKVKSAYQKSADYLRYFRTRRLTLGLLVLVAVCVFSFTFGSIGVSSYYGLRTGGDTFKIDPSKGTNVTYNNRIERVTSNPEDCVFRGEYIAQNTIEPADFSIPTANVSTENFIVPTANEKNDLFDVIEKNTGLSWTQVELADIFSNPEFGGEKLIAPGTAGSYYFTVKNNAKFAMQCTLRFEDLNDPKSKVPMLYRFRTADDYLMGNDTTWLTLEEIIDFDIPLNISKSREFILDWKWIFEDLDNLEERDQADTALGNQAAQLAKEGKDLEYKIRLIINAEQCEFPDDPGGSSPVTGQTMAYVAAGGMLTFGSGIAIIFIAKRKRKKKEN